MATGNANVPATFNVRVFVLLVLAVSVYFAPVWGELPLSLPAVHRRLIFLPWRE